MGCWRSLLVRRVILKIEKLTFSIIPNHLLLPAGIQAVSVIFREFQNIYLSIFIAIAFVYNFRNASKSRECHSAHEAYVFYNIGLHLWLCDASSTRIHFS